MDTRLTPVAGFGLHAAGSAELRSLVFTAYVAVSIATAYFYPKTAIFTMACALTLHQMSLQKYRGSVQVRIQFGSIRVTLETLLLVLGKK
jgi:hypothetical protein